MTVAVQVPEISYAENGVTVSFPVPFRYDDPGDLRALRRLANGTIVDLINGVDFTATPGPTNAGGALTVVSAAPAGVKLTIWRETERSQETEYIESGPFTAASHQKAMDKAMLVAQEQDRELDRSLKVPPGLQAPEVNPLGLSEGDLLEFRDGKLQRFDAAPFAGKFYVGQAVTGKPLPASGTGTDGALRADLAQQTGGDLVALASRIPGAPAIISLEQLGSRRADIRDWNGVDLTGANESTAQMQDAAVQSAVAGVRLELPAGRLVLTSPVEVPAGGVIEGVSGVYMANINAGRTTFHIAHSGSGFTCTGAEGGRVFRQIATLRDQPMPGPGWEPADLDWDFDLDGTGDNLFDDILLINPTKGIVSRNGGGRQQFSKVWGQPLSVGIQIDNNYDRTLIENIHFWNFWSEGLADETFVWDYTTKNATVIYTRRNDNPIFARLFSLFYRHQLRVGEFPFPNPIFAGTTQKLRVYGMDADVGGSLLTVDPDVNGAELQIFGAYQLGDPDAITGGAAIDVQGSNCDIAFYGRTKLGDCHVNAVRVVGPGSAVKFDDLTIRGYNVADDNHAAFFVEPAAFGVDVRGNLTVSGGVSGAPLVAGGGRVNTRTFRTYTPSVASSMGALGAPATIDSAVFKVEEGFCTVIADVTIPDNGTGSQSIRLGLPVPSLAGVFATGSGTEIALTGNALRVFVEDSSSTAGITTFDNAYPGGSGARLVVQFSYRVA